VHAAGTSFGNGGGSITQPFDISTICWGLQENKTKFLVPRSADTIIHYIKQLVAIMLKIERIFC
jgi:hypothetical protein